MSTAPFAPLVSIVMGSRSDLDTMTPAAEVLDELGIPYEVRVISAHRTPNDMLDYAVGAKERGLRVLIAGAGGAAALPGMLASATTLPVIGVPVSLSKLDGIDSLLSIAQMPSGVPVATMAIDGAYNAGIMAGRILGLLDPDIADRLDALSRDMALKARACDHPLEHT
ncbi:MAG: 5-(carboxyamino)imidazole ribonucleotide mutase [Actinobacteria bacterium]|nr:5-(carboxyamino)imidazole ribonucleotide mutase [Actinomycetota bacterium]MCL6104651.1 5-(carboxyamino)imidazole ribonucleotide mutase [Actinomycetota bacterium]